MDSGPPLVENPVQTELLYIQVDSGTHGMVRWKPKTMVERQTARAIVDHMATLHKKKNTPARPIRPWRAGPICTSTFGRRTATRWWRSRWAAASAGGQLSPGWRRPGPLAAQVLQPQDLEAYVLAQIHGALSGESL